MSRDAQLIVVQIFREVVHFGLLLTLLWAFGFEVALLGAASDIVIALRTRKEE